MGFHVRYIDTVIESNEPVLINRGRHGAVLVSLDEYNALARTASVPREANQIKDLLKDVLAHPETGKGTPQALTGALAGLWSREYGFCCQIVYQILADEVKIYAIGKNIMHGEKASPAGFHQTSYSEDEYRSVLAQMAANQCRRQRAGALRCP